MDVIQKVIDLSNLALDDRGSNNERLQAAVGALRLIKQYELLGKKRIDVTTDILEKITNPLFAEGVASRAEQIADSVDRVLGSVQRVSERFSQSSRKAAPSRGGKRKYR